MAPSKMMGPSPLAKVYFPTIQMRDRNSLALCWQDVYGNRFHVWLDPKSFESQLGAMGKPKLRNSPVIYKNPPEDANRGDERYFETRYLDGSAGGNAATISKVREIIDIPALVAAKHVDFDEADTKKAADRRVDYIRSCKLEAGEELYTALKELMEAARSMGMRTDNSFYVAAQAAITKADADAHTLPDKEFV